MPVLVTFGVFTFLSIYYSYCYLYPTIKGDFYGILGLSDMWENETEMKADQRRAGVIVWFFVVFACLLFTSIVLTIITSPGYIPEDTEWDMPMEDTVEAAEELAALQAEQQNE
jgi:hypothetical protein